MPQCRARTEWDNGAMKPENIPREQGSVVVLFLNNIWNVNGEPCPSQWDLSLHGSWTY